MGTTYWQIHAIPVLNAKSPPCAGWAQYEAHRWELSFTLEGGNSPDVPQHGFLSLESCGPCCLSGSDFVFPPQRNW